jgi:hypothetical protein
MNPKFVKSISNRVYRRFPEVAGNKPKIRKYTPPKAKTVSREPKYLLIFRGSGKTPTGKTIPRRVRVIANEKGNILKISTSK